MITSNQKSSDTKTATEVPIPQRGTAPEKSVQRPVIEKGARVEISSYNDLVSAFETILSKEKPGVRIHFTGSPESVLAHKFLLEMKTDLPIAVTQLKEFLVAQGAPQSLLERVQVKFPPASLQGLSLNKSQQLFATDRKGTPIPLIDGKPPVITDHGKALVSMLDQAVRIGDESRVSVNFVLPKSSDTKSIAMIRDQVRELLAKGEEDLRLPSRFREVLKIVTRDNFNQKTLSYREPVFFNEFINQGKSKEGSENQPHQPDLSKVEVQDKSKVNAEVDYSNLLQTFEIFCTHSITSFAWNGEKGAENSVFVCSPSNNDSSQLSPDILNTTTSILFGPGLEIEESSIIVPTHVEDAYTSSVNLSDKSKERDQGKEEFQRQHIEGTSIQEEAAPHNAGKDNLAASKSSLAEPKEKSSSERRSDRIPFKISRVQNIEDVIHKSDLQTLRNLQDYEMEGLKEKFESDSLILSYRSIFEEQLLSDDLPKEVDKSIQDIYEKVLKLTPIIEKLLSKRLEGYAPKDIPERANLLLAFNKAGAEVMKSLAYDCHLTSFQQTETWKVVEFLRGFAHVLADEPSMLPWKVSSIGPHHGKVKKIDLRTGDVTIELDDKRWVTWKNTNRRDQSQEGRSSPSISEGDSVVVHVAILNPPVDELSKEGAKRSVNFNGKPVNNNWRAARFELIQEDSGKVESNKSLHRRGFLRNSTRNSQGKELRSSQRNVIPTKGLRRERTSKEAK